MAKGNARNVSLKTLYRGNTKITLLYSPTDVATQFLQKLTLFIRFPNLKMLCKAFEAMTPTMKQISFAHTLT